MNLFPINKINFNAEKKLNCIINNSTNNVSYGNV